MTNSNITYLEQMMGRAMALARKEIGRAHV